MSCSKTQHLVLAGTLAGTTIWANSADDQKKKKIVIFFITKKTGFDTHAMGTICMKCKSCFLGRMRKIFQNVVC